MASAGATFFRRSRVQYPPSVTHALPIKNSLYANSVHFEYKRIVLESPMSVCVKKSGAVRFSLIDPDGGKLVELIAPESQRNAKRKEAGALPQIRLSRIDLEWAHVVSEGWASPLGGFMRQTEFLQTLHFNFLRLQDGSIVNMSVPIVLAIDDLQKEAIGQSNDVALLDPSGRLVAVLRNIEIYKHNKEERIARTWGTTAPGLPYVEEAIAHAGNWLIGGDLEVLERIKYNDGLDHYRLFPKELSEEFTRCKADAVFDFQLRNLIKRHKAYAVFAS